MVTKLKRQISFPNYSTCVLEVFIFGCVFMVSGAIGLNLTVLGMLPIAILFVAIMMISMIITGVYRSDISGSVIRQYKRTAIGYLVAGLGLAVIVSFSTSQLLSLGFIGFVLLLSFFVVSTLRPVILDSYSSLRGDRRAH